MSCKTRLKKAYDHAKRLPLQDRCRYVVISDCHRGTGTVYDNFLKNQHLYFAALEYYYMRHFCYIELGDGEELWENRDYNRIRDCHSNVYWMFENLKQRNQIVRVYGNHNMELKHEMEECVVLENKGGGRDICLLHGHQADVFNSVFWRLSRFLVRYFWKPLEKFGVNDPTSAAVNYKKQKKYEHCLEKFANEMDVYLIAGHSHRPRLPEHAGDGLYVNSGSCVHPRCITAIEIEHGKMTLVKWTMATRPDMTLFVDRVVLAGPLNII